MFYRLFRLFIIFVVLFAVFYKLFGKRGLSFKALSNIVSWVLIMTAALVLLPLVIKSF